MAADAACSDVLLAGDDWATHSIFADCVAYQRQNGPLAAVPRAAWLPGAAAAVLLGGFTRRAVRRRLGVQGSAVGDGAAWLCCAPCALAQEARTLARARLGGVARLPGGGRAESSAGRMAAPLPQEAPTKDA